MSGRILLTIALVACLAGRAESAPAVALSPPARRCRVEIVLPDRGERGARFIAWLNAHPQQAPDSLSYEASPHAQLISSRNHPGHDRDLGVHGERGLIHYSGPLFGGLPPGFLLVLASPIGMDLHRLAEERSVAYHRVIAERLRDQPAILDSARRRVQDWLESGPAAPAAAPRWAAVLAGDTTSIAAFLVERSEQADELRQSSPFAGALDPRERWQIWRATRDRLAGHP